MTHPERSADSQQTHLREVSQFDETANDVLGRRHIADVDALQAEVAQLRQAMESRAAIEQARGILMCRYGIGADAAFQLLRRWSSGTNVKLRVVAQMLVDVVAEGTVSSDTAATSLETAVLAAIDAATLGANDDGDASG